MGWCTSSNSPKNGNTYKGEELVDGMISAVLTVIVTCEWSAPAVMYCSYVTI